MSGVSGVVAALVVLAVLLAAGTVLAVRPRARRLAGAAAALRGDVAAGVALLRAQRRSRHTTS